MEFQVNDRVKMGKLEGVVSNNNWCDGYPLQVRWDEGGTVELTNEGCWRTDHKTPVLELISRPKKKETVTVERWMNVYPHYKNEYVQLTEQRANDRQSSTEDRIACIKLTGSYEREVEQ